MIPFRIKICGVTNVDDAQAAADAGADAIGLNFYEKSPRYIAPATACKLTLGAFERGALPIGVFVNSSVEAIQEVVQGTGLYGVQLHGDEPPQAVADLRVTPIRGSITGRLAVIRARRFGGDGVAEIARDLSACQQKGAFPTAVLVDAFSPGRYGGTGETVSWVGLADHARWMGDVPLILAGGLTPENVAEAIRIVRPAAVDVASGVEASPGKKDPSKVRDFVAAAKAAFEGIANR